MKEKGWIDPQDAWWCHFQAALRPRCIPVDGVESVSAALRLRRERRGEDRRGEREVETIGEGGSTVSQVLSISPVSGVV